MRLAAFSREADPASARSRLASESVPERPIDLVYLARATEGDAALESELLAMFTRQSEKLGERVQRTDVSRQARADISHRLRGSALAIGAFTVAEAAGQLETALEAEGGEPQAELAALEAALTAARSAIAALSG